MKKLTALFLTVLMLFALAACSDAGTTDQQQPSDGDRQSADQGASDGGSKDTLIVALSADIQFLDSFLTSSATDDIVDHEIYDGLVRRPVDGAQDKTPTPWIAESWEISDDGLTYTFKLRDDVLFHNGTPMTADDVAFTVERAMESAYMVSSFGQYVEGAEVIDDYTVAIKLKKPYAPFLDKLDTSFPIHSRAYWAECAEKAEAEGTTAEAVFLDHPIGTGPYQYVSRVVGSSVTLKAFPDHFCVTPGFENLEFKVITDPSTVAVAIETGEVDLVGGTASSIPAASIPLMEENPDLDVTYVKSNSTNYITFNSTVSPVDNPLVRKAITYAVDKQFVIDAVENGNATIATGMTMDLVFGHSDKLTGYPYDPEKAKELLAEAGYPNGEGMPTLEMKIMEGKAKSAAEIIQENLRAIGVDMEILTMEKNAFLNDVTTNGDYTMAYLGVTLGNDAAYYSEIYTTANIGGMNMALVTDPEIDAMFAEADVSSDSDFRLEKYEELLLKLEDECYYGPIYNGMNVYVSSNKIQLPETYNCLPFLFQVTPK